MVSRAGAAPPLPADMPARPPTPAPRPGMPRRASSDSRQSEIARLVHRVSRGSDEDSIPVLWFERMMNRLESWWKKKVAKWKGRPVGG